MQQGTAVLRPMSLGDLLDASFTLYRRQFMPLMFVALAAQAIPLALSTYVEVAGGVLEHPVAWLVSVVAAIILGQIGIAASTFMVSDTYLGSGVNAQDAFRRAQPFIGRLIVAAFASALLYGLGFLLLIIPGFIVVTGLAVTAPAIVLENQPTGTAGMSRSWFLTKGHRWKILGAYVVSFLLMALPALALGAFGLGAAAAADSVSAMLFIGLVLQVVLTILAYPFFYVLTTLLYYDLRVRKEAYDLETLTDALGPT